MLHAGDETTRRQGDTTPRRHDATTSRVKSSFEEHSPADFKMPLLEKLQYRIMDRQIISRQWRVQKLLDLYVLVRENGAVGG